MSKKILLIVGILIIIAVAAFLILGSSEDSTGENRVGFSIKNYFPFGQQSNNTDTGNGNSFEEIEEKNLSEISSNNNPIPRIRKISKEPIAGAVIYNMGTTTFVRFVEKGTGNVYEARSDRNTIERLTNTTIPKIVSVKWLPDASGFIAQTVDLSSDLIETSFVKITKKSTLNENLPSYNTTISKLPTNIYGLTVSPDSSKVFYYLKGVSSFWFVSNPDGTNKKYIYESPILELESKWIDNDNVFVYTKPSLYAETFAYNFNVSKKLLTKIYTSGFGLSFNPKKDALLISNGGYNISVVNSSGESINLNTNTLSEKCSWYKEFVYCGIPESNTTGYMESWYKGKIETIDNIRRIDTANLFYTNIANLKEETKENIDIIDIQISDDASHLIFTNKRDEYLWLLRI